MKYWLSAMMIFACIVCCQAAPPMIEIPSEVKPSQGYIRVSPKTDAVSVTYVSLDGLYPFPSEELRDQKRFVLPVAGVKAGRYRFVAVGASKDGEQSTTEFTAVIGDQPIPPGPNPPPVPPTPAPKGFRVIFVYETSQAITPAMQQVMFGEKVRNYLDGKTIKGGNQMGWRRFDPDIDIKNEKDADIKALWLAAKPQVTQIPCVIVAVDGKAEIIPFPSGEDAALATLKQYGGP